VRPKGLIGNPDFLFPDLRIALFVDGCFWHGCERCGHIPRANQSFWKAKIKRNIERDVETTKRLEQHGYRVIRLWEHELRDNIHACIARVAAAIGAENVSGRMS